MSTDTSRQPRHSPFLPGLPRGSAILWLALALLILLAVPLFALAASLRADVAQLRRAAHAAQAAAASPPPVETLTSLQAGATGSMAAEATLEAALDGNPPWRAILERIVPPPTAAVRLSRLEQSGLDLSIEGVAANDLAFRAYLGHLQGTPLLDLATLQASTNSTSGGAVAFSIRARLRSYAR